MKTQNSNDLFVLAECIVDCEMAQNPTIPSEAREQLVREEFADLLWQDTRDTIDYYGEEFYL